MTGHEVSLGGAAAVALRRIVDLLHEGWHGGG